MIAGKKDWTPAQSWGYMSAHVNIVWNLPLAEVYQNLFKLVQDKDYFVVTSNVDGK